MKRNINKSATYKAAGAAKTAPKAKATKVVELKPTAKKPVLHRDGKPLHTEPAPAAAAEPQPDTNLDWLPNKGEGLNQRLAEMELKKATAPNAKYPFGIKIMEPHGVSYERFKIATIRDSRLLLLSTQPDTAVEALDYAAPEKPAAEPTTPALETPAVEPNTPVEAPKAEKPAKTPKAAKAPKAEKPAKAAKAEKPADGLIPLRLYAKGEFYFGRDAAAHIGPAEFISVEVKGKKVTLVPTTSKDATPVGRCHAAPVLRVAKVLADTGWSKTTQDLKAKPVGLCGLEVEIA